MRLILYKIIYSIIRLNQHCLLQKYIPLMQHTWPSEFCTPHSRIGSQLLLRSWWRRLQPSDRCQVFENDSPWLSILIVGTSKITRWQIRRIRILQKRGNTLIARNSRTDSAVYAGALSWWRSKHPIACKFHSNSHHRLSQMVQDFNIISVIHCTQGGTNSLWTTPAKIEKKWWPPSDFWNAHASFLLSWRLWRVPFLRVIFEKPTFVTSYSPIKKIWLNFQPFKHFWRHSFRRAFFYCRSFFFQTNLCTHCSRVQIFCDNLVDRTHSLTHSLMQLSPSWEASNCAATQELPTIL
jgi:hypothetical protein